MESDVKKASHTNLAPQFHMRSQAPSTMPPNIRSSPRNRVQNMNRPVRDTNNEVARLNTSLANQGASLRKQKRRNEEMRKELQKVRRQNQELKWALRDMEVEKNDYQEGYNYVINRVVHPYAKKMDLFFDDSQYKLMDVVMRPLFEDAMQARALRGRFQISQEQIKAQRDEINASQEQASDSKQELMATQNELQTKQSELQVASTQLQQSQECYEAAQVQLQASRIQVQSLQKQMLASVDKAEVYTDDQLHQDFRALLALIKSLSRSVRLTQQVDVISILKPLGLLKGVSPRHWSSRGRMKCYIEAWVWSLLLCRVFGGPFQIFGKLGDMLNEDWVNVFDTRNTVQWPEPARSCELWRYTTMEQLVEIVGRQTIIEGRIPASGDQDQSAIVKAWREEVLGLRGKLANTIGSRLTSVSSSVDVSRIPNIVDKAFGLAMNMSLQRSRLQVTHPEPGTRFDHNTMSPMPDANGDDMTDGTVAFIVNPGLVKWGDANGRKLNESHSIERSLVQLE